MMDRNDLITLARQAADEHQLPPEVVCAVVEQESNWNPWAIRYEPAFFSRYIAPLFAIHKIEAYGGVSLTTEAYARSFSWGLLQLMGQSAREIGYDGALSALCDPVNGLEWGCKLLAHKLAVNEGNWRNALLAWNGGGNSKYPDEVLARVDKYETHTAT